MDVKIAHINDSGKIQTIREHLVGTAEKAQKFASEFECGDVGYLCGLMHDIGKYSEEFQKRIRDPEHTRKVDHYSHFPNLQYHHSSRGKYYSVFCDYSLV